MLVVHAQQGTIQGQAIFQRVAQMGRDANSFDYSMIDGYGKDSQILQFGCQLRWTHAVDGDVDQSPSLLWILPRAVDV